MRLNLRQINIIQHAVTELAGKDAIVRLFGSRTDDNASGGDIDLLVEIQHVVADSAWLSAKISGRISYLLGGQKVDVILLVPNLERFPIHHVAQKEGIVL